MNFEEGTTDYFKYSSYLGRNIYFRIYPNGDVSCLECKRHLEHRFKLKDYDDDTLMKVGCPICNLTKKIGNMNIGVLTENVPPRGFPIPTKIFKAEGKKPEIFQQTETLVYGDEFLDNFVEIFMKDDEVVSNFLLSIVRNHNEKSNITLENYKKTTVEPKVQRLVLSETEIENILPLTPEMIEKLDNNQLLTYDFFSMVYNGTLIPDLDFGYKLSEEKQNELKFIRAINDTTREYGLDLLSQIVGPMSDEEKYFLTIGMCFSSLNNVMKSICTGKRELFEITNKISYPDIFLYAIRFRPESKSVRFDFNEYEILQIEEMLKKLFSDKYSTIYTYRENLVDKVNYVSNWIMYCALWKRNILQLEPAMKPDKVFWSYSQRPGVRNGIEYYNRLKGFNKIDILMNKDFDNRALSMDFIDWKPPNTHERLPRTRLKPVETGEYLRYAIYLYFVDNSVITDSVYRKIVNGITKTISIIRNENIQMRRTNIENTNSDNLLEMLFSHVNPDRYNNSSKPILFHMISSFIRLDNELALSQYRNNLGYGFSVGPKSRDDLMNTCVNLLIGIDLDFFSHRKEYLSFIENEVVKNSIGEEKLTKFKLTYKIPFELPEQEPNTLISFLETFNLLVDIISILKTIPNIEYHDINIFGVVNNFGYETSFSDFLNDEFRIETIDFYAVNFDILKKNEKHPYHNINLYKFICIRYGEEIADKIITFLYYSVCHPLRNEPKILSRMLKTARHIQTPGGEKIRQEYLNSISNFYMKKKSSYYTLFFTNLSRQLTDNSIPIEKAIENSQSITMDSIERDILLNNELTKFNLKEEKKKQQ